MEKSNSEGSVQGSGDEAGNLRDEEPTTSKAEYTAERNSHNMNDLKVLDFNSADEVRWEINQSIPWLFSNVGSIFSGTLTPHWAPR